MSTLVPMATLDGVRIGGDDGPLRKKPRIHELPLSSAKRASIDALLHTFKKKGEFDALRKKTYKQFEEGDSKTTLLESLRIFTDEEIDRDPLKYLAKDRRLAAPLLEGAAARANIYPKTEEQIGEFVAQYLDQAEIALREIRRKEIGEDAAREEEAKGAKSDDVYGADAEIRRQERAKRHIEEMRLKKRKEREEAKKAELEALKKRAMELTREKEKMEREQKRRAEREALRKKQKEAEAERLKKFQEEQEKIKKEKEERQKVYEEEMAKRKKEEEAAAAKRLEEQAMRLLLREGERTAEKSGRRSELRGGATRSPSPEHRHHHRPRGDDERSLRARSPRRSSVRDLSAEREAWKAKLRREHDDSDRRRTSTSMRDRSRSPAPRRRHRDDSRSPLRRREKSRSRTPPRRSYRERDYSPPPRRRSRSRSPPDIDRYVPSSGRRDDRRVDDRRGDDRRVEHRRERDRESQRDRERDNHRERDRERDRDRERVDRERDHDRDRRRRDPDDKTDVNIDRYVPNISARFDDDRRRAAARPRSRTRSRERK